MDRFVRWVDGLTEAIGRSVSWLVLAMTAVTCLVVVLRYGFSVGSIALKRALSISMASCSCWAFPTP